MKGNGRDIRFTEPLYTIAEASAFLGVHRSTFTDWTRGYERRPPGRKVVRAKAIVHALPAPPKFPSIPFVGLAEGLVVQAFRRSGVSIQHIRRAVEVLRREMELAYALASKRFYTDGARVLFDHARRKSEEELGGLTLVISQKRVFAPVVRQYLECIEYGGDEWPTLLVSPVTPVVAADPKRSFGQPIFIHGATPVEAVIDRWEAGDTIAELSADFGVPERDIEHALRARRQVAA